MVVEFGLSHYGKKIAAGYSEREYLDVCGRNSERAEENCVIKSLNICNLQQDIIKVIKSWKMRRAGHATGRGEARDI
jgi:hypothetical protein